MNIYVFIVLLTCYNVVFTSEPKQSIFHISILSPCLVCQREALEKNHLFCSKACTLQWLRNLRVVSWEGQGFEWRAK